MWDFLLVPASGAGRFTILRDNTLLEPISQVLHQAAGSSFEVTMLDMQCVNVYPMGCWVLAKVFH